MGGLSRDDKCGPCGANPYEDCPRDPCEYQKHSLMERIKNRPNDAPLPTEYLLDEAYEALSVLTQERDWFKRKMLETATVRDRFSQENERLRVLLKHASPPYGLTHPEREDWCAARRAALDEGEQ